MNYDNSFYRQASNERRSLAQLRGYQRSSVALKKSIKQRKAGDMSYVLLAKIRDSLSSRMRSAFPGYGKLGYSTTVSLGCSLEKFKNHIEKKFEPGMTWENWGNNGWHLDHIKQLKSFDLKDEIQFDKACHYTNFRPCWAIQNK